MTGGYAKSVAYVIIGLKTVKGTKQLKLDPSIYDALIKEKVNACFTTTSPSATSLGYIYFS